MFELKDYQQKALAALDAFFFKVRTAGLGAAWQHCAPLQDGQSGPAPYDKRTWRDACRLRAHSHRRRQDLSCRARYCPSRPAPVRQRRAVLTRDRLEIIAAKEADYLRPVLLFQAEDVNGEANVETLLAHLSSADGEKLDRVLRMPYARPRQQAAQQAPATCGVPFAPLPPLCLEWEGELQPVERRVLAELGEFDLFALAVSLPGFSLRERATAFEIDVDGDRVVYGEADSGQLHLNEVAAHPAVKHWVRNVGREERFSFWLPTATDYFYPDFVAEYKGAHLLHTPDTREKEQIGQQWVAASGGQCLFC